MAAALIPGLRLAAALGVSLVLVTRAAGASNAGSMALRPGQQPAPSLFGINTGTFDANRGRLDRDLPTARSLGATWVHFTGDSIKYARGRVSFALMDRESIAREPWDSAW